MARKALGDAPTLGKQLSAGNCCGMSYEAKRQYSRFVGFYFYRHTKSNPALRVAKAKLTSDVHGGRVAVLVWFCVVMSIG